MCSKPNCMCYACLVARLLACVNNSVSVHAVCYHITCLRFHAFFCRCCGCCFFCNLLCSFIRCCCVCIFFTQIFFDRTLSYSRVGALHIRCAAHNFLFLFSVARNKCDCYRLPGSCFIAIAYFSQYQEY